MPRKPQNSHDSAPLRQITTAVLVDGGFYRKRASELFGRKTAEARAAELVQYCHRHIKNPARASTESFITTVLRRCAWFTIHCSKPR